MTMMSMVPFGILISVGLFYFVMPDLNNENFRYLVLVFGTIGSLSFITALKILVESPLNLIQSGNFTKGVESLKKIIDFNNS